ncbi:MAG: tail fiber domain-containing protein, partial [Chitinophagales bacterium]|nr:tail fiber domain-containing protein [Chitinophagales bacterium]
MSFWNIGSEATAQNALFFNTGVSGLAPNTITFNGLPMVVTNPTPPVVPVTALPYNAGVVGMAQGAPFNFGGAFMANDCNGVNIGVYGSARRCLLYPLAAAGYFQGVSYSTGGHLTTSDAMFKDSIETISNAIGILSQLQPKQFVFKTDSFPYMNFDEGLQYGLIAQQIDTTLPAIVRPLMQPAILDTGGNLLMDTFTFKTLNYTALIPLAIAAIQELDGFAATKAGVCDLAGSTPAHYLPK